MKRLYAAATTMVLALTASAFAKETHESLNLAAMIQPVGADGIYTEPGYATWDGHLFKEDGKYFLLYSVMNAPSFSTKTANPRPCAFPCVGVPATTPGLV